MAGFQVSTLWPVLGVHRGMNERYNIVSESDLRAAAEKTQIYLDTLPVEQRFA